MKKILAIMLAMVFLVSGCSTGKKAGLGDEFLGNAHAAVKKAYGENYIPQMEIEKDFLKDIYGIPMDSVEDYIAEGPMMSSHVDNFIGLRVKADSVDKVATALKDYHKVLIENSIQYPMNVAKVQAAEVLVIEDHVFFLMLGAFDDDSETEEDALKFAKEQVQIGVNAIKGLVK